MTTHDFVDSFTRYTRGSMFSGYKGWLFLTMFMVVCVWIGIYVWDLMRRRRMTTISKPSDLFRELCDAHQLSRIESETLRKVAVQARLAHPAAVFFDPVLLERAGIVTVNSSGQSVDLRQKLFGPRA